ncbi:MAG TPA: flagellin [Nitrobacter sp.]|nr:flagellin [Nitrobacter sp.]
MSDIVLSASVRQNLLSLQSTADLLATTQERLSTGKKVNSALDNPTNYFTAQALDNRAGDINNLLDGIGNGVQVLQAANTGLTALQKLVDSAKSVANQVLQSTTGYSTRSSVTALAIPGATPQNLLGTATGATAGSFTAGTFSTVDVSGTGTRSTLAGTGTFSSLNLSGTNTITFNLSFDGGTTTQPITIDSAAITAAGGTPATATETNVIDALNTKINAAFGTTGVAYAADNGGKIDLTSGTAGAQVVISGYTETGTLGGTSTLADGTAAAGTAASSLSFDVTVDGGTAKSITIDAAALAAYNAAPANSSSQITDPASALSGNDIAKLVNYQAGANVASFAGGKLTFASTTTGTASSVLVSAVTTAGGATDTTGIGSGGTGTGAAGNGGISGQTLTIASTAGGIATNITFGTGQGQISTLNQLNAALLANNLQASIDPSGAITISTTNDAASATMGAIGGSAAATGSVFAGLAGGAPVADPTSQQARAGLVAQYNNIIANINSTAQDASFNGINLLNGDTLKLIFNETGKSVLNINGTVTDAAGLGLGMLTEGTDFVDSDSANKILTALNNASSQLRTAASTLGANLSIVEIRQDFSKNLINVLQTGSSNLTLADTNEEAANSQALSTRQSIAVSALALANQSQQSVLQLLR